MAKDTDKAICSGNIDTAKIYAAHSQIKEIVESYNDVNLKVSKITLKIKENWVNLSARGSRIFPIFDIILNFLAIFPSIASVKQEIARIDAAII